MTVQIEYIFLCLRSGCRPITAMDIIHQSTWSQIAERIVLISFNFISAFIFRNLKGKRRWGVCRGKTFCKEVKEPALKKCYFVHIRERGGTLVLVGEGVKS